MNFYDNEINKLKEKDSFRYIPDIEEKYGKYLLVDEKKMLNLSSNDYLTFQPIKS